MKVFFDVDGVLIQGWHASEATRVPWDATLEADLGVNRAAFQRFLFDVCSEQSDSLMHQCITGQRDLQHVLAEGLPALGSRGAAPELLHYWFTQGSNVDREVLELVRTMRQRAHLQVFFATGQEHHRARYLWDELGFCRDCDGIFYSARLGYSKKDPRFFEAVNRALAITPEERPVFFDDQEEVIDLRGASWP